jgi:hypothetical protein
MVVEDEHRFLIQILFHVHRFYNMYRVIIIIRRHTIVYLIHFALAIRVSDVMICTRLHFGLG